MELKDVILSTLAEMEVEESSIKVKPKPTPKKSPNSELLYLSSIRERLLVLFEGFQAPNNKDLESKIDMTLNFLEYTLSTIDKRVEELEKGRKI